MNIFKKKNLYSNLLMSRGIFEEKWVFFHTSTHLYSTLPSSTFQNHPIKCSLKLCDNRSFYHDFLSFGQQKPEKLRKNFGSQFSIFAHILEILKILIFLNFPAISRLEMHFIPLLVLCKAALGLVTSHQTLKSTFEFVFGY